MLRKLTLQKMASFISLFICLTLFSFINEIKSQDDLQSPCPRLFVYEGKSNEPDKWYGILTLLSESDLTGVWIRLIFDKPSIQLGNWIGQVSTTDNKEYLIKNRQVSLKANTPQTVRFFLKYDPSEPAPRLESFRLNAKTVCPEGAATEAPAATMELQTSSQLGTTANPVDQGGGSSGGAPSSGGNLPWNQEGIAPGGDDEVYPGDFYNLFNRPVSTPEDDTDINAICGTVIAQPRPLITHGQTTREGEFPWHAALYHARGIDLAYICGASLISKYHVITVAHCVTKRRSNTALNPDNLVVYLGKYYLRRFSSPGIQDRQVAEILPHPRYHPQTYSNDIALVKFTAAVDVTDYVRPVCLWQESTDLSSVLNKQGNVVGWGFDETGKVTEQLMQAHMPVVNQETCLFSFPDFYSRFTSSNTFCAGFRNGTSVCNGDSGGGMVFPKPKSNKNNPVWQLRGLVSISVALQNQFKCDAAHYVVFTDAAKYLDWIKNAIK